MIDLYQVHFDDPSTPVSETVEALEQLVDQGKIREYGLGHLPVLRIWEYTQIGSIYSVMMEFNALSREAETELLPFCLEHDLAAIAFSVTGRGLLTGSITTIDKFDPGDIRSIDPQFQRINFESGLRVAEKFDHLGKKYGKTAVQYAIAWALTKPGITCALTGPSSVQHLEENLGGAGWEIAQEDLAALDQFFLEEGQNRIQELGNTVRKILNQPLPEDPEQALIDLVYASEGAIKLKYIRQEDMLPIFLQLIELRGKLDGHSYKTLAEIQQDLASMIQTAENE
jgi:aryl-alcohol dehydrogenase-like predicted oxidoreductase